MSNNNNSTATQSYIDTFDILSKAGVGVTMTRTREPHRCSIALRVWAEAQNREFRVWNCVTGWLKYIKAGSNEPKPTPDKAFDLYAGLKKVNDVDGNGTNPFPDGVFVVQFPHWHLEKQHGPVIQLLLEYSRDFTETKQRIVLLCPEGVKLPKELENDVSILDFSLPSQDELRSVLDVTVNRIKETSRPSYTDEEKSLLIRSGAGMTAQEFENAISKGLITHRKSLPNVSSEKLNAMVIETKTDVIKRSDVLELMPQSSMKEVGGMDLLKAWIEERKLCFSDEAIAFGVDQLKGICFIGPPGTGKSLGGKAIADSLGLRLIRFDVSRVFGSLIGQTEGKTRSALQLIDAMAPCVVLIDEIDKAGLDPRQAGGDSGVSKRVMGAILTHMQESSAKVFWILTANRVASLPPELLRKGRLDEVFAVLPPNHVERVEVFKIHLAKRKQNVKAITDLDVAIRASKGFVQAEIEACVKEAVIYCFAHKVPITGALLAQMLGKTKPISEAFPEDFADMRSFAENNARPVSTAIEEDEDFSGGEELITPKTPYRRRRSAERERDLEIG